jgi:hypothetical protein
MPHREHAMLGPGGEVVIPISEHDALTAAIQHITHGDLREAIDVLKRLRRQAGRGYHRNGAPFEGASFAAGKAIGKIGDDVHSIRYRHAKDHKHYQHDFNGDVIVYAVERNGKRDLLLTHREGSPLWDEF